MFGLGARSSIGQGELETGMPIAFLQQVRDNGERTWLTGMLVEDHVEFPVQLPPAAHMHGVKLRAVFLKDALEPLIIGFRQMRCRGLEQARLQQSPEFEQFLDLFRRESGDDGAAVGMDLHEPLRFQLHQGFSDRDPADAELHSQRFLAELEAGLELAVHDAPAQLLRHGGGDGAVLEGLLNRLW
jgi:hypothetical protein